MNKYCKSKWSTINNSWKEELVIRKQNLQEIGRTTTKRKKNEFRVCWISFILYSSLHHSR